MAKRKKPKAPPSVPGALDGPERKSAQAQKEAGLSQEAVNGAPVHEPLNAQNWLWLLRQNQALRYGLMGVLYFFGFVFIHAQGLIWGKNSNQLGVDLFNRIFERGKAYGVYQPVNLPDSQQERDALTDLEREFGVLPDETAILKEMKDEAKTAKLNREELAAPEREGLDYLKKAPPDKAPWKKWQFEVLPQSVYGKPEDGKSKILSPSMELPVPAKP